MNLEMVSCVKEYISLIWEMAGIHTIEVASESIIEASWPPKTADPVVQLIIERFLNHIYIFLGTRTHTPA